MMTGKQEAPLTFDLEETLPSLPLPPLDRSLENYLESVRPLVTQDEYQETVRVVRSFQEDAGPKLQEKLQARADSHRNWLEAWWEKYAYLQSRQPIAVLNGVTAIDHVNMTNWPPRPGTQLIRASQAIWISAKYFQKLRREEQPIDKDPTGNPVSMHQLRSIFNACREPGEECDKMLRYFRTEREGPCPNHVVVFSNGHIYRVEVFDSNENLYGSREIMRQLVDIKKRSLLSPGQGVGVLTATTRDDWAKAYRHMCSLSQSNQRHFETIRTAIFGVSLDSDSPTSVSEALRLGGSGRNVQDRWFDKEYFLVIFESGMFIYITDHTALDGFAAFKLSLNNLEEFQNAPVGHMGSSEVHNHRDGAQELSFTIDDLVEEYKQRALETFNENAPKVDIIGSHIECGRGLIKSNKISSDAFMQMAIQLAYFEKYKEPAACYETGATVMFYHGRTDTIRTCTQEMVDWCAAMVDQSKTNSERFALMKAVNAKHRELTIQAVTGQAFDRHLLGLYITALEGGIDIPDIFLDPSFSKSGGGGNYVLSTSQLGRFYQFGSIAPMRTDGYSIFYNILQERIYATVVTYKTCDHTDSLDFLDRIRYSVVRMQKLLKGNAKL